MGTDRTVETVCLNWLYGVYMVCGAYVGKIIASALFGVSKQNSCHDGEILLLEKASKVIESFPSPQSNAIAARYYSVQHNVYSLGVVLKEIAL